MDLTNAGGKISTSKASALPTELVELILSHVDGTDRATCAAVCLTSKLARRAAVPNMYRIVGIQGEGLVLKQRQERLHLLVRTLFHNPALALHVSEIRQDLYSGMGRPLRDAANDDFLHSDYEAKMYELGVGDTSIGEFLLHLHETRHISNAWHFFMLMILCPNVTELTFTGAGGQMKSYNLFPDLVRAAESSDRPCGLQKVQQVQLLHTTAAHTPTLEDAMLIMKLPHLQTLVVSHLSSTWPMAYAAVSQRSSMTSLEIRSFSADPDSIGALLEACPNLERLVLHDPKIASPSYYMSLSEMLSDCHALKRLSVTVETGEPRIDPREVPGQRLEEREKFFEGSVLELHHVPQLAELCVDYCLISSNDDDPQEVAKRLPPTLKKLKIVSCDTFEVDFQTKLLKLLKGVEVSYTH